MSILNRFLLALSLLCLPVAASAEEFDIFRFKVPYDIDLGTGDYDEVTLRILMTISGGGTLAYPNDVTVKPSQDGKARGTAVFEYRRSVKTMDSKPFITYETLSDGTRSAELLKEDYDRVIASKKLQMSYWLIWATHKNGERHWFAYDGTAKFLKKDSDDSQALMLSSGSLMGERRDYAFSDNQAYKPDLLSAKSPESLGVARVMTSTELQRLQAAVAGQGVAAPTSKP
ncbi:MAG: hypothetical protein AAF337_01195 [Pseudomonadota bacterium]